MKDSRTPPRISTKYSVRLAGKSKYSLRLAGKSHILTEKREISGDRAHQEKRRSASHPLQKVHEKT